MERSRPGVSRATHAIIAAVAAVFLVGVLASALAPGRDRASGAAVAQSSATATPQASATPAVAGTAAVPPGAATAAPAPIGMVTSRTPGVQVTAMPRIVGSPFTAFTVVVPATGGGPAEVTVVPSPGELALAGGQAGNLQVVNTLTNVAVTCMATAGQLTCTVPGPGQYTLLANPNIASGRGPGPIEAGPQQGAGVVSVAPIVAAAPPPAPPRVAAVAPIETGPQQNAGVVSVAPAAPAAAVIAATPLAATSGQVAGAMGAGQFVTPPASEAAPSAVTRPSLPSVGSGGVLAQQGQTNQIPWALLAGLSLLTAGFAGLWRRQDSRSGRGSCYTSVTWGRYSKRVVAESSGGSRYDARPA